MKYEYKIELIEYSQSHKLLTIILPKEIQIITNFLVCDVGFGDRWFLEKIDRVLNKEEIYLEAGGNDCILQISYEKTKVLDGLAEDGIGNWCEIETRELKELILIWLKAQEDFKDQIK